MLSGLKFYGEKGRNNDIQEGFRFFVDTQSVTFCICENPPRPRFTTHQVSFPVQFSTINDKSMTTSKTQLQADIRFSIQKRDITLSWPSSYQTDNCNQGTVRGIDP